MIRNVSLKPFAEKKFVMSKRKRHQSAIALMEKQIKNHQSSADAVKKIIEDHQESGSKKFEKFPKSFTDDAINKMRDKKIERLQAAINSTRNNMR